jgi:hypothetical protein
MGLPVELGWEIRVSTVAVRTLGFMGFLSLRVEKACFDARKIPHIHYQWTLRRMPLMRLQWHMAHPSQTVEYAAKCFEKV